MVRDYLAKKLWISLIRDLERRGLIDLPPELQAYNTSDLIDEVKRVVVGPKTWSPAWSGETKHPRQTVIPLAEVLTRDAHVELLPAGRYFAGHQKRRLEFYDTIAGRRVYVLNCAQFERFWHWGFEMMDGDDLHGVMSSFGTEDGTRAIEVFGLNLLSGHLDNLLRSQLPANLGVLTPPTIVGNFFVVSLEIQTQGLIMLVNWRTEEYVFLNCPPLYPIHMSALVPGHLVITHRDPKRSNQQYVLVYALSSFGPFWRPIAEMSVWHRIYPRDVSPLVRQGLEFRNIPVRDAKFVYLRVLESPLRRGTYKIMLQVQDDIPAPPSPRTITSFMRGRFGWRDPQPIVTRSLIFSYALNVSSVDGIRAWRVLSTEPAARGNEMAWSRIRGRE
ncbi:hypothetical protein B0H11DRAFT_2343536 [Mycena galericulata]|nr:hypothetical protein B0H11DRAFT_2343536 [Mycena galericulata]